MDVAELTRDRYRAALPRLRDRLAHRLADEREQRWAALSVRLQADIDNLAEEFRVIYPVAVENLLSLFTRVRQLESSINQHNAQSPPGSTPLLGVELRARGLESFSTASPSVLDATVLLDPHDGTQLWPPKQLPHVALSPVPIIEGPGADWHQAATREAELRRAEHERVVQFYAERQREREGLARP
jgi:hypothetical protein